MGSFKRKSQEFSNEDDIPPSKQLKQNDLLGVACLHDVSYPEGYVSSASTSILPQQDSKPAKEFPFPLDPFQSEAINCLNNGESVMVSFLLPIDEPIYQSIFLMS